MSTSQERTEIFKDTMAWIEDNEALAAAVGEAREGSTVYLEGDTPSFREGAPPAHGGFRIRPAELRSRHGTAPG